MTRRAQHPQPAVIRRGPHRSPLRVWAAFGAFTVAVALFISACGEPVVPVAQSSAGIDALVTATPLPVSPTPVPSPTALPTPTPEIGEIPDPTPTPVSQPGLNADTVRVAVIADEETGGTADDLFRDAWTSTQAWALEVNSRGGLGGRNVEVIVLNSALTAHADALRSVCEGDFFAIVGSQSLGDSDGAELLGTSECDIADFPGDVHGARRAASPNTFLANPILNDRRQAGPARWLALRYPETIESVTMFWFDELELRHETERLFEMLSGVDFAVSTIDTNLDEGPSERVRTRFVEFESEAIVWNADPQRLTELLRGFKQEGIEPTWVLCEFTCYSEEFLRGGDAVEGVYTWIPHVPVGSQTAGGKFLDYRYFLREFAPTVGWSEVGIQSWMAGRLFEAAFNRLLEQDPEGPTREALVDIARQIDSFSANGMLPITDPGGREPTPCFALMVVRSGGWEQVHPVSNRDLDCATENLFELAATRNRGLEAPEDTGLAGQQQREIQEEAPSVDPATIEPVEGDEE